jgi:hypothetical protein
MYPTPLILDATSARTPGSWTLAVLPDTQFYSEDPDLSEIWSCMMDWLVAERSRRNIRMVLHVGDLVNANVPDQWEAAANCMRRLRGELPVMVTTGNHDLGREGVGSDRHTYLNDAISHRDLAPMTGAYREGRAQNSFTCFEANGEQFLVLSLEFGPRDSRVEWAGSVLADFPEHRVLVLTHEHIDQESSLNRTDGFSCHSLPEGENSPYRYNLRHCPGGVNCGTEMWQKLYRHYPNIEFVFNGHYKAVKEDESGNRERLDDITTGYRCDETLDGGSIHQLLFNAQWAPNGGDGWLRLLEFHPNRMTVSVKTVSPWFILQDRPGWRTGPAHSFTLKRSRHKEVQRL